MTGRFMYMFSVFFPLLTLITTRGLVSVRLTASRGPRLVSTIQDSFNADSTRRVSLKEFITKNYTFQYKMCNSSFYT